MAQTSVSSFFNTRKRGLEDEIIQNKKKVICLDRNRNSSDHDSQADSDDVTAKLVFPKATNDDGSKTRKTATVRQGITPQRRTRSKKVVHMQSIDGIEAPKIVNFWKGGNLSPQKKSKSAVLVEPEKKIEEEKPVASKLENVPQGLKTPVKASAGDSIQRANLIPVNAMKADEIKKKLKNSSRLADLKTSLNKLNSGLDKLDQMEKKRLEAAPSTPKSLKPFKSIELEILSPSKRLTSPMKLKDSPMKNTLLGSPKVLTPKRLFSPTKSTLQLSPVKAPAFQRFQNLAEPGTPTLQLPYKYRYVLDIFNAVDTVCAMFFNRKEKITFKKLKPAVQRILRRNFYESHLAQINHLMPDAYKFAQEKTRNYGSTSKTDYYQLVISPNVASPDEDVKQLTLSPQALIERRKRMTEILTDLVFAEHEKFLQTLEAPISVTRKSLRRWHPEFNLEGVKDLDQKELPQPPNVEKFSSAKDVLSTARNLFSCSTPMERALELIEKKKKEEKPKQAQHQEQQEAKVAATPAQGQNNPSEELKQKPKEAITSSILKGVPTSLLEKIRAKQAAKAHAAMTRRPSQEREAVKYSRLPEIARHARNVFVTEKKGVLLLETLLKKIENSYKGRIGLKEIEALLKLIASLLPQFMTFKEIRCAMYVTLNRESDLTAIVEKLEKIAAEKSLD